MRDGGGYAVYAQIYCLKQGTLVFTSSCICCRRACPGFSTSTSCWGVITKILSYMMACCHFFSVLLAPLAIHLTLALLPLMLLACSKTSAFDTAIVQCRVHKVPPEVFCSCHMGEHLPVCLLHSVCYTASATQRLLHSASGLLCIASVFATQRLLQHYIGKTASW